TKKSTAGNKKTAKKSTSQPRRGKGSTLRLQDPFLMREQTRYASPLPSREFILELLHQADVPVMMKELIDKLGIQLEEEPAFIRRLHAMQRQGEMVINRKGALCLPEKVQLIKGRVQGHADGFGFVLPDDGSPDLFLSPKEM